MVKGLSAFGAELDKEICVIKKDVNDLKQNAAEKSELVELRQQLYDLRLQVAGFANNEVEAEVQQLREDCAQLQLSQVPDSVFEQVRAKEQEMVARAEALKED
eukprot:1500429-Karenia_brevis.AAC.1